MKKSQRLNTIEALRYLRQVDVREPVRSFVNKTEGVVQQHASSLGVYSRHAGDESFCKKRPRNRKSGG